MKKTSIIVFLTICLATIFIIIVFEKIAEEKPASQEISIEIEPNVISPKETTGANLDFQENDTQQISSDWLTFSATTSLYSFKYPDQWQIFTKKGQDTSTGEVYVVPPRNTRFIKGETDRYHLQSPETIDEYIEVSGGFLYSFADSLEKFLPGYKQMIAEGRKYIEETLKGTQYSQMEVLYGNAPAYVSTYELNGQKIYSFTALAKGSPSNELELGPVIVGFKYVATPQYFSQEIAENFRASFSDTLIEKVRAMAETQQEKIDLENKDVKEYSIVNRSSIDPSVKITSNLTDWDGHLSSDVNSILTSITQTTVTFTDKKEPAIKLVTDGLGHTVGIFRNYTLPKNADVIEFCFNFQGTKGKDNVIFFTSDKPLLNFGVTLEDNEFIHGDTMLFPRDYIETSLSILLVNRSGNHVEATFSRFRAVSTKELLKNPLNCDT